MLNAIEEDTRPPMPKITLYVKDADQGVWNKAREMSADSLSGFVTAAVREQVDREGRRRAAHTGEMALVELEVDNPQPHRVRFTGQLLAHWAEGEREEEIYLKRGGELVYVWGDTEASSYRVYESIDDLKEDWAGAIEEGRRVAMQLLAEASEELGEEFVVDLD